MQARRALPLLALGAAVCGAIVLAGARGAAGATATKNDAANGKAWWAHIQVLASDAMKGRQTGSPEYLKAAAYVVDQFKSYGLQPAGVNGGWYQPVHFVEKGLLGSRYFAGHPTVPERAIRADLNLDMFMPLFALNKLHVQGLEQSTLEDVAKRVGAAHDIVIAGDPEPDRNSFIRTDQYSFVQAGVPALAMKFGWTYGSPEYHTWRNWLAERYHSTADDLNQPVDLVAAAQFNAFYADLVRAVANDAAEPHYLESSFFRRFEVGQ